MKWTESLKANARNLKRDVLAVYLACKRKDLPWYTKLLAVIVVGYALSPIDLIPDFIPVLGYLDDIILIPAGIALLLKLIPEAVMAECRKQAEEAFRSGKPKNWLAGSIIILIWAAFIGWIIVKLF